jgi:iron complex outermembrane recepter protein
MNRQKRHSGLIAAATLLGVPLTAVAQSVPAGTQSASASDRSGTLAEVTVTGSRVITNGNDSPSPVTVVQAQELQQVQPTTIADGLNDLPVFAGSRGQYSNPSGAGVAGAGNPAATELNLRNLGANRNLILFDGQRVPSTLITGIVDVNMIPQMLLQRVDMVTGGVSAVYGSDAITGVVNFVTNRTFEGVKLEGQTGISHYGDDRINKGGIAFGTRLFGGRAHFEGSYEHYGDAGVLHRSDRPWDTQWAVEGKGTAKDPYQLVDSVRLSGYPFGGLVARGVLAGQNFASNGTLSQLVNGAPTGSACCQVGGQGGYFDSTLKSPLTLDQAFGRLDFDLTDDLHGHVEATGNVESNNQYVYFQQLSATLSAQNPLLPQAYQTALAAAGQSKFTLSKLMQQDPLDAEISEHQYFVNGGLDGKLGKYDWGLDFDYGSNTLHNIEHNDENNARTFAALDAVVNPATGQIVCSVTLTNPGLYPGCVPLSLFGPTAASAAALNYILGNTNFTGRTKSYDMNGHIIGAPFKTWAGPVTTAISTEWRRQTYSASSDADPTALVQCTGLRFNCPPGTPVWNEAFASLSGVSQTVREAALEFDAPLLAYVPLVRSFNLNGAVRYTDYDTSGAYWTWKGGFDWHLNRDLTFRGTQSRDIRAPTLNDLYSPETIGSVNPEDLLTGTAPVVPQLSSGNRKLTAEIGHTSTAGVIWRPGWLEGLSLTLDGYYIKITNAITRVQGFTPTFQQICYASGGASPYCELQARPLGYTNASAANAVTAWYAEEINIAEIETYGADFEANYLGTMIGRHYALRGFATYQPHIFYRQPGTTTIDQAGAAFGPSPITATPSLRVTGMATFEVNEHITVNLMERWRSAMKLSGDPTQVWINNHVDAVAYTDLNLSYRTGWLAGEAELFLNVANLFDKDPPPAAAAGSGTIPGQYGGWSVGDDPIGRYFTLGLRYRH